MERKYITNEWRSYELYHHGILGMKWGIRRFQNKDGSLTAAGRKRYNVDISKAENDVSEAKREYSEALEKYKQNRTPENEKNLIRAAKNINYKKEDLATEKTKEKMNLEKGSKSKHRLKLEEEYRNKGMTKEEAEIAAYKRAKTEKIIIAASAIAVASLAAYVAYKHYDTSVDKIIKSGTILQSVTKNSNKGVEDAFYASYKNMDKVKYRGILGGQQFGGMVGNKVFNANIGVKSSLKVASEKSGAKVLSNLVDSDPGFKKDLVDHLFRFDKEAAAAVKSGRVDKKVFEAVNQYLVVHDQAGQAVSSKFYSKLRDAGYDAIVDINDKKFSGYRSRNPIIVFNGAAKTAINSISELSQSKMAHDYALGYADITVKDLAPRAAAVAAAISGIKASNYVRTNASNDKIVREYRKEHPNTKLSYSEILRLDSK